MHCAGCDHEVMWNPKFFAKVRKMGLEFTKLDAVKKRDIKKELGAKNLFPTTYMDGTPHSCDMKLYGRGEETSEEEETPPENIGGNEIEKAKENEIILEKNETIPIPENTPQDKEQEIELEPSREIEHDKKEVSKEFLEIDGQGYKVFKALASKTRWDILIILSSGDKLDISQIAETLNQTQANVSAQMKILEKAGLIKSYYEPAGHGVRKVCEPIYENIIIKLGAK